MNLLNKLQLEMAVKEQREMLPEWNELCKVMSEQMRMYYDALVETGFTEEQAMLLVTQHGINVGRLFDINFRNNESGQ